MQVFYVVLSWRKTPYPAQPRLRAPLLTNGIGIFMFSHPGEIKNGRMKQIGASDERGNAKIAGRAFQRYQR